MNDALLLNELKELKKINERQRQELARLKQANAMLLHDIIASLPGCIYWKAYHHDQQGVYLGCNDEMAKMAGFQSHQDIIGKTDFDLVWRDSAPALQENDRHVVETGETLTTEESGTTTRDQATVCLTMKSPLKDNDGHIIVILGVSIDITAQKRAEALQENLHRAQEQLHVLEALGRGISYELRNLVASMQMMCDGLLHSFPQLLNYYEAAAAEQVIRTPLSDPQLNYLKSWESLCRPLLHAAHVSLDMFAMNFTVMILL